MSDTADTNGELIHVGRDEIGGLACTPDSTFMWYLTDCCGASAKGTEAGICCRRCYHLIDPALGMAWTKVEYLAFHDTCPHCDLPFSECSNSPIYHIPDEHPTNPGEDPVCSPAN